MTDKRMRGLLAMVLCGLLGACADDAPEARVRAGVAALESAVEARRPAAAVALLSEDFSGDRGQFDRAGMRAFLAAQLDRDAADSQSSHDFGKDLIPALIGQARVYAHRFEDSCVNMVGDQPYWRDVGTLEAYWEANLDLTQVVPELNLYDASWPMLGRQVSRPPAKFVFDDAGRRGMAVDSLVSAGCIVSGATVRRSILFYNVRVGEGSLVEDSVVLPNVTIGRGVTLRRTVIDKHCVLPDGFQAGLDPVQDRIRFHVSERGITLVTPAMLGGR